MKLMELFSPLANNLDEQDDIDWLGDLKFFIDNDDRMLEQYMFPAIKVHREHHDNPKVYQAYIKPLQECLKEYVAKYEVQDASKKFPKEAIIELAKSLATTQGSFIKNGDYED